jgi:broad specificity phosphatase PhoE
MVRGVVGGPRGDTGLTAHGRSQVAALRDRLLRSGAGAASFFSSPLPRALETARGIAPALGDRDAEPMEALGYRWPSEADGLSWEEHRRLHSISGGGVFRPYERGGEPWAALVARLGEAMWEIACEHRGLTSVIVTHEEMIDASFRVFGDVPLRAPFDVRITPTSITEWTTRDDPTASGPPEWKIARWTLERFNDAGHLEGLAFGELVAP